MCRISDFELTHFPKLSPNAENAPPSVDNQDIKSSSSTLCHVAALARSALQ